MIALALTWALTKTSEATLATIGQVNYNGSNYSLIYDNDSPFGSTVYIDYSHTSDLWGKQMSWAQSLNSAGTLSYTLNPGISVIWNSDWRLPNTKNGAPLYGFDGTNTSGTNITSSEMGHIYYTELGNKGIINTTGNYQPGYGLKNSGPFMNLKSNWYWTGTEYGDPSDVSFFGAHVYNEFGKGTGYNAWSFSYDEGTQLLGYMGGNDVAQYAMAVRSGMVFKAVPVPEPTTTMSLSFGLAGMVLLYLRRRNVNRWLSTAKNHTSKNH